MRDYMKSRKIASCYVFAMLALYSFVVLLFCTKSSPFFAFNDWFDANCYFTMGKGMMNGYVPYVDLIDNKGPLLFLLYGIGWLMDHTGFSGIYLLQSVFLAISVIYTYRLAKLFIKRDFVAILVAIFSPLPMLLHGFYAAGFDYGGGGPDEFCRAILVVSLYYFAFYHIYPEKYRLRHTVVQGVLFACVFMIKFNLSAFWVGFLFAIACELLFHKRFVFFLKNMAAFATGALLAVLPYLAYAIHTKSLDAFYHNYFVYNSLYTRANMTSLIRKMLLALSTAIIELSNLWAFAIVLLAGLIFVFITCKNGFVVGYSISLTVFLAVSFFAPDFPFTYIPIVVFLVFGLIAAGSLADRITLKNRTGLMVKLCAIGLVFAATIGMNRMFAYPLFLTKSETCQQQMASVIQENAKGVPPTLLEVGRLDSGFYTASGIIPTEPFYYIPNVSYDVFPDPYDSQLKAIQEKRNDFVITGAYGKDVEPAYYAQLAENYDRIAILQGTGYQKNIYYHLFQLKQ